MKINGYNNLKWGNIYNYIQYLSSSIVLPLLSSWLGLLGIISLPFSLISLSTLFSWSFLCCCWMVSRLVGSFVGRFAGRFLNYSGVSNWRLRHYSRVSLFLQSWFAGGVFKDFVKFFRGYQWVFQRIWWEILIHKCLPMHSSLQIINLSIAGSLFCRRLLWFTNRLWQGLVL